MKLIISATILLNLLLLSSPALAQDYPTSFIGPGYREYLNNKIRVGYYVDTFVALENRQKERVNKRNQIEDTISTSYQANSDSAVAIQEVQQQKSENATVLNQTVDQERSQRTQGAAAQTEFYYVPYSDGRTVYFRDGLATKIENERVIDEFGNVSIKDTTNMQYNDKRLLTSYDASLRDNLGNTSHISIYGMTYSADSLFYADEDTNAVKNELEKHIRETDPAGNERTTHWQATSYDGNFLRAFHQEIEDTLNGNSSFTRTNITYENDDYRQPSSYHEEGIGAEGLAYSLDRTNMAYNDKDQVVSYQEEKLTTRLDGAKIKTITEAQFEYLAVHHTFGDDVEEQAIPDRLLNSTVTTTTQNPNGSNRAETTTTTYEYDQSQQLISASGNSVFVGQEDGGNKFSGTTEIEYEILEGRPMFGQTHSRTSYYGQNISDTELQRIEDSTTIYKNGLVNNLPRLMGTEEHTEITDPLRDPKNAYRTVRDITTSYLYDAKGNLIGAQGTGTSFGYEYANTRGWHGEHTSTITIEYEVRLNKALRTEYKEDKDYKDNKGGEKR